MKSFLSILPSAALLGMFSLPVLAQEDGHVVERQALCEKWAQQYDAPELIAKLVKHCTEIRNQDEDTRKLAPYIAKTQADWVWYLKSMQLWAQLVNPSQSDAMTQYLYKVRVSDIFDCYDINLEISSESEDAPYIKGYELEDDSATEAKYAYPEKEGDTRAEGTMSEMTELAGEIHHHYLDEWKKALDARMQAILASDLSNKKEIAEAINIAGLAYGCYLTKCRRDIAARDGSIWPMVAAITATELLIHQLHVLDKYFPLPEKD